MKQTPELDLSLVPWKDLETKGYVVIRGAFSPAEVQLLLGEYNHAADAENSNYNIKYLKKATLDIFRKKFAGEYFPRIGAETSIKADFVEQAGFFATANGINFDWHIDPESYFINHDHFNYLNLYVPIVKPSVEKSNLSLIPCDLLQAQAPELYSNMIKGRGAIRMLPGHGKVVFVDDHFGRIEEVEFDYRELVRTPELAAGDMLVMRGDLIHKTQDNETERINISFRANWSQAQIKLSHFDVNCIRQAIIMSGSLQEFQLRRHTFAGAVTETMTFAEHYARYVELRSKYASLHLPALDREDSLLSDLGTVIAKLPAVSVVVVEEAANPAELQLLLNSANSFGASLIAVHEKQKGILGQMNLDRALPRIVVNDLKKTLTMLKGAGVHIAGIDPLTKRGFSSSLKQTKCAFVLNGDKGPLTDSTKMLCDSVLRVSPAFGRTLALSRSAALTACLLA
jgi:hypothetical protein